MIQDYKELLTAENLSLLEKRWPLFSHVHSEIKWMTDAYYNFKNCYESDINIKSRAIEFPKNIDEIIKQLLYLKVIKTDLEYDEYAWALSIKNINFQKISLFKNILHKKPNSKHLWILNKLSVIIEQESHMNVSYIISLLNIKETSLWFFNDAEILLHSLQIWMPKKISKLIEKLLDDVVEDKSKELLQLICKEKWVGISKKIKSKKEVEIHLSQSVIYNSSEYIFINILNNSECNIKDHGSYDKMMDMLLQYPWEFITYEMFEKESWMRVMIKKGDCRGYKKRITDTKNNLLKLVESKLKLEQKKEFIKVNNGLKLVIQ